MEPFLYLDESMQHTIQDSRDLGVAGIGCRGDSHQVAQSSTRQGDCEPVLMDEDRPVLEDQENVEDEEDHEEEVSNALYHCIYPEGSSCLPYHREWER